MPRRVSALSPRRGGVGTHLAAAAVPAGAGAGAGVFGGHVSQGQGQRDGHTGAVDQAAVPGMICGPQSQPSPQPRWTWRLCPQHAHDMSWGSGVRETSYLMDRALCKVRLRGEVVVMVGSNVQVVVEN
jgi:hypothetical protein